MCVCSSLVALVKVDRVPTYTPLLHKRRHRRVATQFEPFPLFSRPSTAPRGRQSNTAAALNAPRVASGLFRRLHCLGSAARYIPASRPYSYERTHRLVAHWQQHACSVPELGKSSGLFPLVACGRGDAKLSGGVAAPACFRRAEW